MKQLIIISLVFVAVAGLAIGLYSFGRKAMREVTALQAAVWNPALIAQIQARAGANLSGVALWLGGLEFEEADRLFEEEVAGPLKTFRESLFSPAI